MRKLFALIASLMSGLIPGAAARAQTPLPTPTPFHQPNLSVGDLHRFEMDRLRNQAEQSQALARSQALQTQMTLQTLQAQRQPPLVTPAPISAPTLEEAHRQREATEAAAAAARQATGQIDSWLDRRPQ